MIELSLVQLGLALGLALATIALSRWQNLGLVWSLTMATARTVLQLFAVGYLLAIVFALRTPWSVFLVLLVMLSVAASVARNRIDPRLQWLLPAVAGVLLTSTAITIIYTIGIVVRPTVWYDPQYVIPLTGIVLGNAMNAASIAGDRLVSNIRRHQIEIETHLSLGATPAQAIKSYRQEAIKSGLIPTVNAMMIVGIVKLPGIITGQLLSNQDPLNAAMYQMLIMFMLAFSDLLAAVLITAVLQRR
ncbi:MAG: iron export ABC transporter permease subunit FetB, partial [Cyanobacteria bacterium P01_H01_bin.58]